MADRSSEREPEPDSSGLRRVMRWAALPSVHGWQITRFRGMPDLASLPIAALIAIFVMAAGAVWAAGSRLAGYVSAIGDVTGIGKAFLGLLLLGGITSLPELATSLTAAAGGNAALAVNNVLGGVAMQVAIIAVADAALKQHALTSLVARPTVMLQGGLDVLLLLLVAAGIATGEIGVAGVGVWSTSIFAIAVLSLWFVHGYSRNPTWRPVEPGREEDPLRQGDRASAERSARSPREGTSGAEHAPLRRLALATSAAGAVIFVAGYFVATSGEAIAEQTGLGASFMGAVLVAISTSLPELSTVLSAVRQQQFELAISDIFGTNLFDIALLLVIDAVYSGDYVLNVVGSFSLVAALLGAVVTTIFILGLIERRNRTVARFGMDSLVVLVVYLGGLVLLYTMRGV